MNFKRLVADANTGLDQLLEKARKAVKYAYFGDPSIIYGWDDKAGGLLTANIDSASTRYSKDLFNGGIQFNSNARYPEEPAVVSVQCEHKMVYGPDMVFRPHFHWLQRQAAVPNMLMAWKATNYGAATVFETGWTNYTFAIPAASAFTYPGSGTFAQITRFPEIDMSSLTISASVDVVFFRDTANASGLFAGADPVGTDVTVKFIDSHVRFDQIRGSRQEYIK